VTIRVLLLGVSLALAGVASAQSVDPPATASAPPPPAAAAVAPLAQNQPGLPPQRIRAMVRANGFDPNGPPARHGNLYVQRALDPNAIEYRVVVDSLTSRIVSVREVGIAGPYAAAGYGPYPPPPPWIYGRYFPPPESGFGYRSPRPPRSVPNAHLPPPQPQPGAAAQPSASPQPPSQPSTTAQAPLPRPKPYVMEATGSIPVNSPKALASQMTPDPQKAPTPPAVAPQSNGAVALPPVAPLD